MQIGISRTGLPKKFHFFETLPMFFKASRANCAWVNSLLLLNALLLFLVTVGCFFLALSPAGKVEVERAEPAGKEVRSLKQFFNCTIGYRNMNLVGHIFQEAQVT